MPESDTLICWLCERPLARRVHWHHPVPKAKKVRATVPVHPISHRTIHANFSNAELARSGGSRDILIEKAEVVRFLEWIEDKPPDFYAQTRRPRP